MSTMMFSYICNIFPSSSVDPFVDLLCKSLIFDLSWILISVAFELGIESDLSWVEY